MGLLLNRKALVAALGLMAAGTANADSLSADINDDAFKFEYKATNTSSNLDLNASALVHDDDGEIYAVGAQVEGRSLQQSNIEGALGGKFYYINLEGDANGTAIGLGGSVKIGIPQVPALAIHVEGYYAPQVLSFNDVEHNTDIGVKAMYRILDNGSVYLGYRKANVDIEDAGDGDLDEGFHIGMQLDL